MKIAQGLLRTATAALLLLAGTALAQTRVTVPTLRSTGAGITYAFNDAGRIRPDPNYTVVLPNQTSQTCSTFHGFINAFTPATGPIPPWLGDSSTSLWVGPTGGGLGVITGTYTYRTSFILTGFEPSSIAINGRLAADNRVTAFRINGVAAAINGLGNSGFSEWTPFQFAAGTLTNLLPSINTIEVDVLNTGFIASPSGFRMEIEATGLPILLDRSVLGFWNFQTNTPLPVVTATSDPLSFSTDAPPGTQTSLRVGPTKFYAKVQDPNRTLSPGRDSTLAAWIKPLAGPASNLGEVIFSYGGGGGYKLWLASGRRLSFTIYGVRDVVSDVVFPNDGQWHHIAAVHQSGLGVVFYLDGLPRDFKAYTNGHSRPTENQLLIGYEGSFTQPFNGLIDDVLIASSALSAAQFMLTPNPAIVSTGTRDSNVTLFRNDSEAGIRNVVPAGDVDGDGYDDVLMLRQNPSTAFLVFGSPSAPAATVELRTVNTSAFIEIVPPNDASLGDRMSSGDINGDGLSDILVLADDLSGSGLYVLYGRSRTEWDVAAPTGRYDLRNLTGPSLGRAGDARLSGTSASQISQDFTTVGDVDGDGYDEVLFVTSARFHLIYGGPSWPSGDTLLIEHPLQREIFSEGSSMSTVSAAGDVNGDGFNDLLFANPQLNRVWLLFGVPRGNDAFFPGAPFNRTSILGLNAVNRRNGIAYIDTIRTVEGFGSLMAGVGDTNGDGLDDFLVGYHRDGVGNSVVNAGRAYLVRGSRVQPGSTETFIDSANGTTTFTSSMFSLLGFGVGAAGDENGDGLADFLIGNASERHEGGAFLRRGSSTTPIPTSITLPDVTAPSTGFPITGPLPASVAGRNLAGVTDFNGDGASDFFVSVPNGQGFSPQVTKRFGEVWMRYGSVTPGSTATARNNLRPANSDIVIGGITTPLRGAGQIPGSNPRRAFTRVAVGFKGGAANGLASQQTIVLRRTAPTRPTTIPGELKVADVHWRVTTDRTQFSRSTLAFTYLDPEIDGLDMEKIDVWFTPDATPTASSAWSPLGAIHDPARRTLTIDRAHNTAASQVQFNGSYAIFSASLVFEAGSEIPRPGTITAQELPPTGPVVEPVDAASWDPASGKLFAARPGGVIVAWTTLAGELRSTTVGTIIWPALSRFQPHILGTPPVILTNWDVVQLTATETELSPESVTTTKHFAPGSVGRSLLKLTKSPSTTAWLLVNSRRWDQSPGAILHAATVGQEIQPNPGLVVPLAPPPFVLTTRARHAVGPDFYQHRTNQSGPEFPIVPVNLTLETDPETRLAVAFYRPTTNAIPTLPNAVVPTNFWPGVAAQFIATWPTNLPATQVAVIASQRGAGRLDPARYGGDWNLYVQNDPTLPGFNPNDEHARVASNLDGDRTLMPLRNDLGSPTTSQPFVLLTYRDPARNGRGDIEVFPVVATNAQFPGFAFTVEAGRPVLPPRPMSDDPIRPESYDQAAADSVTPANRFLHDDRKGGLWAKAGGHDGVSNGVATVRFFYQAKEADFFPGFYPRPTNNAVPLLDLFAGTPGVPIATTVFTAWPTNAPRLFIGESLVDAKRGLPVIDVPPNPDGTPGVGGPCSVTIIYDQATAQNPLDSAVTLIDPLLEQQVPMGKLPAAVLTEVF